MIELTRFDGSRFHLNADLIEVVESNPDTHITLVNGHRYLVSEPDSVVIDLVVRYHRETNGPMRRSRKHPSPIRLLDMAEGT